MISKMTGWKDVYLFTLKQKVKGKGFKITTIILVLLALVSMPIVSFFTDKDESTSIDSLYVVVNISDVDNEKFINDLSEITKENELYTNINYLHTELSYEEISKEIEQGDKEYKKMAVFISYSEQGMIVQYLYGKSTGVSQADVNNYKEFFSGQLTDILVNNLSITTQQYDYINTPIKKEVVQLGEKGEIINSEGTVPLSMPLYGLGCFIFAIFAFVLSINAESITTSIITEKSSRVIEYIMISIRPMAIVVGKVLSMLTITFLEIIVVVLGFLLSISISPGGTPIWLKEVIINTGLNQISGIALVLAIIIFILGFLLYSIIAALLGATVSKIEEASEATKIYMIFMFIGIYMSIALIMLQMFGMNVEIYEKIVFLVPFSAAVALPFYLIIGKASIAIAFISLVIIIICLVLLVMFVSRVYGYILYHNGSTIKLKELFKISKQLKQGGNEYE